MGTRDAATPIIIKRKKVSGGGGHHGGAWKVAYADFVTAMMAFFLLMWLLNATTEKQRKGIADYFSPTIPFNRVSGGGDGSFGGDSVFTAETLAHSGSGAAQIQPGESQSSENDAELRKIEEALMGIGGESMVSQQLARHIVTKLTDEGLIVEFFDLPGEPLFSPESDTPEPITRELAQMLSTVFGLVNNSVAINGHTRAYPHMLKRIPVWELSAARAQTMRRLLEEADFAPGRIARVTGFADRKPSVPAALDLRNNRIEVILLRSRL
ncbi:chemotaxis protein MotB [Thioclava sp. BHET1]|uniref:Chemotaxis protein MotB n=1 Tax=Thioclava dalianensis TaxID=1185766 RepID=A0A074TF62_9RHOB|nr:flagellar motor protein MotB [Thioclava dalianensis]KEP70299.1 chemotaxis protein MotB [Thioclava dalianensis]TMV94122.1 chemotaxis protein MotB [Thioclava sp. BHET1]SFN33988.1 chemotaxis protein MotB [Thioclava dalianensis]